MDEFKIREEDRVVSKDEPLSDDSNGYNEEAAGELSVTPSAIRQASREVEPDLYANRSEVVDAVRAGRALGWFALVMAIAALFVWPVLMGLTAAVLGFVSYRQGNRALGIWAITIGLIAAVLQIVFIPMFYVFA